MTFCITIDGPAAAGKGTISKALSKDFGLPYLDTGLLYRAAARKSIDGADPLEAALGLVPADLDADGLRTAEIGQEASRISAIPSVREALKAFQVDFSRRPEGAILDGRSVAIEICPDAAVKFYITASDEVRARRRASELQANGVETSVEATLADLRQRDNRDARRATAPMQAAPGAILIDTTMMAIKAAVDFAHAQVKREIERRNMNLDISK